MNPFPSSGNPRPFVTHSVSLLAAAVSVSVPLMMAARASESVWVGDSSGNGNWSDHLKWNPATVPNGSGVNVTVPFNDSPYYFNGPRLDVDTVLNNLSLGSRGYIHNQTGDNGQQGNLTVNGTTTIGDAGSGNYGVIAVYGGKNYTLGTLTNYVAATKTLTGGGINAAGASIRFHGADIVTNNGFIFMGGDTAAILNQDNSADALTNFAVNNGTFQIEDGYNFTTSGNFTNNLLLAIGGYFASNPTVMTITGELTNYNPATHTLSGNGGTSFDLEGSGLSSATLRFPGADIRVLDGAYIHLRGDAHITDLAGLDGLRNFGSLQNSYYTSTNGQVHTPESGTFTNSNSTHTIDQGASVTVAGNYNATNGNLNISAPSETANSSLVINGSAVIEGGSLDMGGQPGVNTQYHSTLQVVNGIEVRGAYLTGTGTTYADIALIQSSTIAPGHSAGQLDFEGILDLGTDTTLKMEIGGEEPGLQYDVVAQHGTAAVKLGGPLELSFIDGFQYQVTHSDSFEILTSENPLQGSFSNVASGGRLVTSGAEGSFKVVYSGSKVILSDYLPNKILSIERLPNGHIMLHGLGVPDEDNRIEASPTLDPDDFATLNSAHADSDGNFEYEDVDTAGVLSKFYRLVYP